jgi:leucyl/phenylalanyl-tRNA--protein transferase
MIDWLDPNDPNAPFPTPDRALNDPNGLLAAGGDLSPERLINAYRHTIFPWFAEGDPLLWWSPNPRMVLRPEQFRLHRSLRRSLRRRRPEVAFDRDFAAVVSACAAPREEEGGTWITQEMAEAYSKLFHLGHVHTVECYDGGRLVGGLYGVAIGAIFYGESMFSRCNDASKWALFHLCHWLGHWGYQLIDCQMSTPHLLSLGASEIDRAEFVRLVLDYRDRAVAETAWRETPPPPEWLM